MSAPWNQLSESSSPLSCCWGMCAWREGGGLGLVVYLTAPFLESGLGHCWRAVALTPGLEQRRWQWQKRQISASLCRLCRAAFPALRPQPVLQRDIAGEQPHKGTAAAGVCIRGRSPRLEDAGRLSTLLPPHAADLPSRGHMSSSKVTWDFMLVAPGPALCAAAFCPRPVGVQVKAQPSGHIPQASVSVCSFRLGFCFLICWIWFYFFSVVVCVFNCSPPTRRCCLKCLFRGHAICLGLASIKPPGLSCSWFLNPGWSWHLPGVPSPSRSPAPLGRGVPEPGKALKLPGCGAVGWPGRLPVMGGARERGVWHWGAAKGPSLADAELPAVTDGSAGLDPARRGELSGQSRRCLCIAGECSSPWHG